MTPLNPGDRPKYMVARTLSGDRIAWYWAPPAHVMAWGAPLERRALGSDYADAVRRARGYNDALDFWRIHKRLPGEPEPLTRTLPGSVSHLFELYKAHAPSKAHSYAQMEKAGQKQFDYYFKRFAGFVLKDGRKVGDVLASDLDPATVDALYEKLLPDADGVPRRRSTNLMMAACRRAWNVARRAAPDLIPDANPFSKMGLDHSSEETRPATYGQLVAFETKAAELGYPEMAFAARAAWELLQRVSETVAAFAWTHWRPADRPAHVFLGFDKTKNSVWKPLEDDEGVFYPELEARLAAVPKRGPLVMVHEARKGPKPKADRPDERPVVFKAYNMRHFARVAEEIRVAAELPAHVTMGSFRHGGLTELGDAGLPDTWAQALSRHRQRATLDRYIHRTDAQIITATRLRVTHRRAEK